MIPWNNETNNNLNFGIMMKIKNLMYVLMGTMLVATSCSDTELENGKEGSGTVDPVNASALVSVR